MPRASTPDVLALHGLRLKGFADVPVIAGLYDLDQSMVGAMLDKAATAEFAIFREGRRTGWALKPAGRIENERLLAAELDSLGLRELVQSAYERFLSRNARMLEVCTQWQVKDQEAQLLNDHADPAYDQAVIAHLAEIDEHVQPICAELSAELDRFSVYGPRFTMALDKLRAGELEWFTKPIMESYHTVWFELHEDLLATLGIDRATEQAH